MTREIEEAEQAADRTPEAIMLISSFGFSCYILWEVFGMFRMLPYLPEDLAIKLLLYERPLGFLALSVSFLVAMLVSQFLIKRIGLLITVAAITGFLVLASSMLASTVPYTSLFLSIATWVFYGLSLTSTMLLWILFFSCFYTKTMPIVMLVGFTIAIVFFFGLSFTGIMQHVYVFVGFILIATTLAVCGFFFHSLASAFQEYTGRPEAIRPVVIINSGAYGMIYGFTLSFLIVFGESAVYIAAGSALAGCLAAWLIARNKRILDNTYIRRITFAPVAASLFFIPFSGTLSYILCSILIISACFCTALATWIIIAESANRNRVNPIALFTHNKLSGWVGFFLGMALSSAVLLVDETLFSYVVIVLTAFICVIFAIFELTTTKDAQIEKVQVITDKRYHKRCQDLALHYRLSARELEVLYLLARGRNAEHIAFDLCIAKPTAKTHIQHIYQKTSVNSQQALIDLVEY
ncbi:MAG: LuxR C-terminal-related transcriptional regulator [Coriobacteriia bacterium]|nr:LuxR C-terminal-related transcriptional regulator [Coriobacteriia bacterium]